MRANPKAKVVATAVSNFQIEGGAGSLELVVFETPMFVSLSAMKWGRGLG
jgi:hypothetical protein